MEGKRFGSRIITGDFIRTQDTSYVKVPWTCDCGNSGITSWQLIKKSSNCIHCKPRKNGQGKGDKNTNWTGGIRKTSGGYRRIYVPEHPYADKRLTVMEHRLVMERLVGRYLYPNENVHHKNGIKNDNRPENLELWSTSQPSGQRVEDKTAWAIEWLRLYAPEVLK
jgi:hypothetical protein